MQKLVDRIFGVKINKTRVRPLVVKILLLFIVFILASNFASNYINLIFNRAEMVNRLKESLIKDLKTIYNYANSQFEIFQFNNDIKAAMANIESRSKLDFTLQKSVLLAVKENGEYLAQSYNYDKEIYFTDKAALEQMISSREASINEDFIYFRYGKSKYYGVYKYNPNWNSYIIRGEEVNEFYKRSNDIFLIVSLIILIMTIASSIVGAMLISFILRFIHTITKQIMDMLDNQKLGIIDLQGATNDDVTFLGVAFNSLSSTISNLMNIFLKFVNKDIANKAYKDKEIRLEGSKKDLTVLFSDIRSFTFMTETLGIDIIKLLNLHYESAIHYISLHEGLVGSIIGDALLAVYGALDEISENKSYQALKSAYDIQMVTGNLRTSMKKIREELEKKFGALSEEEERVFRAVLIEVGVGIDGGDVFYGTIGSSSRMTNTVIGDNVNSASRLEGLTRVYNVPVICSEYIKDDIEKNVKNHGIRFVELDTVLVKGKTIGRKVFWPIQEKDLNDGSREAINNFSVGLKMYYAGEWEKSVEWFNNCNLPMADEFLDRTKNYKKPTGWNGIWTMTTK